VTPCSLEDAHPRLGDTKTINNTTSKNDSSKRKSKKAAKKEKKVNLNKIFQI
jgi:hypothetical protein